VKGKEKDSTNTKVIRVCCQYILTQTWEIFAGMGSKRVDLGKS
jgi:hypothetical protein